MTTWLAAVTGYTMLTFLAPLRQPGAANEAGWGITGMLKSWIQWDAGWHQLIANNGYQGLPPHLIAKGAAFPPLFPVLIRATDYVLPGTTVVSAMAVSAAAFLGLLVVFFRLVETEFGSETAERTIWMLVAFPTAFLLFAPYNMSLLLLLVVSVVYAARQGKWWIAGVLGGLTVLTRASGVLLMLPFAYEYLRQKGFSLRKLRPSLLWIAGIPAGFAVSMAVGWHYFGDPLANSHAQRELWGRHFSLFFMPVIDTISTIVNDTVTGSDVNSKMLSYDLIAVLFVGTLVVLGFVGPWKFRKDQLAIPLTGLAILLFSLSFPVTNGKAAPLFSAARYMLEVFPAFIVLGRIGKHTSVRQVYVFGGLILQGFFILQYLSGNWVA